MKARSAFFTVWTLIIWHWIGGVVGGVVFYSDKLVIGRLAKQLAISLPL